MTEVCKDPVDCDAAGPSAVLLGTALVVDSHGNGNRLSSHTTEPVFQQADPQPEHRVLAEGSIEAAKHAASGDAPKRKKRKVTPSQSTDNLATNRQRSHQSLMVNAPMAQQADLQPSITTPELPKEPEEAAWEDGFLSQGYIDTCERWLAEAVQGSENPKCVAVHIMVLAHYWEFQVLLQCV
ncbi:hypothetical protein WJX77_006612 [Trebouxia sp. C0004]